MRVGQPHASPHGLYGYSHFSRRWGFSRWREYRSVSARRHSAGIAIRTRAAVAVTYRARIVLSRWFMIIDKCQDDEIISVGLAIGAALA